MSAYLDTSFLFALYRPQRNTDRALRHLQHSRSALPVAGLLHFEFAQAVRFQIFRRSADRLAGISQGEGTAMLVNFEADLRAGVLALTPVAWADLHPVAERLSDKHVIARGHRAFDLLHVATAVLLGTREFLTFDANQRRLAEAEGLTVPL